MCGSAAIVQQEYGIAAESDSTVSKACLTRGLKRWRNKQTEQLSKQLVQIESEIEGTEAQLVSLRRQVELIQA